MFHKSFKVLLVVMLLIGIAQTTFFPTTAVAEETVFQQTEVPIGYIGIYSPEDLQKTRNNLSGKYILMNDVDLTETTDEGGAYYNYGKGWVPIGDVATPFTGIFDGNGYKISGLKISIESGKIIYAGFFGYAKKAKIMNLGMVNSTVNAVNISLDALSSQVYAGGIVGYGYDITLHNNYNTGKIVAESIFEGYAGGIAGYVNADYNTYSSISKSYNSGEIYAKTTVGGLVGEARRTNLEDVSNHGKIKGENSKYAGGIAGKLMSTSTAFKAINLGDINFGSNGGGIAGWASASVINDSQNEGRLSSVVSSSDGGGIAGTVNNSTIKKVYNNGEINSIASSSVGGGIVGDLSSNSSIVESYNKANINVQSYAGGITGMISTNSVISQSYNTGNMSGGNVGGISAWFSSSTILDSFNIGAVKAKYEVGGIVAIGNNGTIRNTYNASLISSNSSIYSAGGIAGRYEGVIENSYYLDNVQKGVGSGIAEGSFKKTFNELKNVSVFEGFNFSTMWKLQESSRFLFPSFSEAPSSGTEQSLNISVSQLPNKLAYVQGEALDLTGAKISLKTNHGQEMVLPVSADMVSGYNSSKTGTQLLKVSYDGLSSVFTISMKAKYEVVFKSFDGSVLKTESVVEGNYATAPEPPKREGYTFSGWSTNFDQVKSNLIVEAKYTINNYSVVYFDGDTVLETANYDYGQWILHPSDPFKQGYTFISWYTDASFNNRFNFYEKLFSEDMKVYAKFIENPNTVLDFKVEVIGFDKVKVSWTPVAGISEYEIHRADSSNGNYYNIYTIGAKETSYIIDGLEPNTTYYLKMKTIKSDLDYRIYSSDSQITKATPSLSGSTNINVASAGFDKVKVSWSKSSEATGYEVHRAAASTGTYSLVSTVTSESTLSYVNSGLVTGRTYYYKVRAYRLVDGKKIYSSFSTNANAKPTLSIVGSAKVASLGYSKNKVSWGQVSGANGYEIYRATSKTGTYSKIKAIASGSTLVYENTGLTTGKTYYYKVRAYRVVAGSNVYGLYSGIVNATPTLAMPSKLTLVKTSSTSIKSSWSKVTEASGYELYRATTTSGTYTKVKTQTSGSTITYTNTGLTRGKIYYYKVRAYRTVNGQKIYSPYTSVVLMKL